MDTKAFNYIGYGLYVITSFDGKKHNGFISNSVMQISVTPLKVAVSINKQNYSYNVIKESGIMNVNILTEETPFATFSKFGFQSGKEVDKFSGETVITTQNGLAVLKDNVNAVLCLKVDEFVDAGSHGLFICSVEDSFVKDDKETMTYSFYHKNVSRSQRLKTLTFVKFVTTFTKGKNFQAIISAHYVNTAQNFLKRNN